MGHHKTCVCLCMCVVGVVGAICCYHIPRKLLVLEMPLLLSSAIWCSQQIACNCCASNNTNTRSVCVYLRVFFIHLGGLQGSL